MSENKQKIMKLTVVIFTTLLLIVRSKAQICAPIEGCDVRIYDNCYTYVNDTLTWYQAEECCVAWGGHLASIHSDYVNGLLNDIRNQDGWTWIGLSDTVNNSVYVWTDGTPFDYNNTDLGETEYEGESCLQFLDGLPTWRDYYCSINLYVHTLSSYICQKRKLNFLKVYFYMYLFILHNLARYFN